MVRRKKAIVDLPPLYSCALAASAVARRVGADGPEARELQRGLQVQTRGTAASLRPLLRLVHRLDLSETLSSSRTLLSLFSLSFSLSLFTDFLALSDAKGASYRAATEGYRQIDSETERVRERDGVCVCVCARGCLSLSPPFSPPFSLPFFLSPYCSTPRHEVCGSSALPQ